MKFAGDCKFRETKFALNSHFEHATFIKDVEFSGVKFAGFTHFNKVIFSKKVAFGRITFGGVSFFNGATFSGTSYISFTLFCDDVIFDGTTFEREIHFTETSFKKKAKFEFTHFCDRPSFHDTRFNIDLRSSNGVSFPVKFILGSNGLPEGGVWFDFSYTELGYSMGQHGEITPSEEDQPDEVPLPTASRKTKAEKRTETTVIDGAAGVIVTCGCDDGLP